MRFERLAKQVACEVVFLLLLKAILHGFWTYFQMLFGGCRDVHVDNATLVKYCIFHRVPPQATIFALQTNFRKSATFSFMNFIKSFSLSHFLILISSWILGYHSSVISYIFISIYETSVTYHVHSYSLKAYTCYKMSHLKLDFPMILLLNVPYILQQATFQRTWTLYISLEVCPQAWG